MTDINRRGKGRPGTPKRNPVCYQTTRDIVIPAGTILRDGKGTNEFTTEIGIEGLPRQSVSFALFAPPAVIVPADFKKVIA